MSHPPCAETDPGPTLYRTLRLVKLALGILATGLTIARALELL